MKLCKYCNKERQLTEFRKNRRRCKPCERKFNREYGRKNFSKRKAWRENNAERFHALQAKSYQKNKIAIHKKLRKRYHSDPEYKKRKNIHRVIQNWIGGRANCQKDSKYLRCSYAFYVKWLEYHGINTEDNGQWHPDHVIPRNKFKLLQEDGRLNENNVRLCYSWFNVMPLAKDENIAKHDNIDTNQLKQHVETLKNFCSETGSEVDQDYYELCATYLVAGNSLELL